MRMHMIPGICLILVSLAGCGARTPALPPGMIDDQQARLGATIDLDLAQLLTEDRQTLATKADTLKDILQTQMTMLEKKPAQAWLLPRLNTSNKVLLHDAKFSPEAAFTLPGYHKPGRVDFDLALHYTRHGDFEAGKRLAPAREAELARVRTGTNYPVEWTLLVATALHLAELKMVDGQPEGATELVALHRQLQDVLDATARSGPLGALLLPVGKQSLADAAAAWRMPGHIKSVLADDIDAAVAAWGEIPAPQPLLVPGAEHALVERVLGAPAGDRGVAATGETLHRAIDLLALPVRREGLDSVVAYLGKEKQLAELQLMYVGNIHQRCPEPRNLVWSLVDRGGEGKADPVKAVLPRAAFQGGPLVYDVTMVPKSDTLAALIVVSDGKSAPVTAQLPTQPLQFSPVMLDRSFEVNRLALDRKKSLDPTRGLVIDRPEVIQTVQQPLRDPLPAEIVLEREKSHDVCRAMHFRWKRHQNVNVDAVGRIVTPLCLAYGRPILEDLEAGNDQTLILRWEQGTVLYSLRLPYSETQAINFAVAEKDHSDEALAVREKAAWANDEQDRQRRLALRKPMERLDRSHYLAGVKLGMSKGEVKKLLPQNPEWHRLEVGNSVILSNLGQPNPNARPQPTAWLRRYVVRFDGADKVAEIRGYYTEGPGKPDPTNPTLIDRLKQANGEPQTPASPWAQVWADLPPVGATAKSYRWQDDVTTLTAEWDPFGVQVTVRDNPKDATAADPLPPLAFVGAGPEACRLGTTREELNKTWPNAPTTEDGALVLVQPLESKFDALVVYLEKDRVQRVVGRGREKLVPGPGNLDAMINRFYAENHQLGLVRRRLPEGNGQLLGGWGWHDDQVRVWAFGQETPEGPRLFVEWRNWPVGPTTTASR